MNKDELQKIAGIVTEGYGYGQMTEEAILDVKKAVSLLFDRLINDEGLGDMETREIVNGILKSLL